MRREPANGLSPSPELAAILRAGQPGLAEEICHEIRSTIPEYEIPDEHPPALLTVVEEALSAFVDRVENPAAAQDKLFELLGMLARKERAAKRSLDSLHAAVRLAFKVAWHRTSEICASHNVSGTDLADLAELQLAFMDEVTRPVVERYLATDAEPPGHSEEQRRRLLRTLAERPQASAAIAELAEGVGWNVPMTATPVAVRPGARWLHCVGDSDVLVDFEGPEPWVLFPGPLTPERRALLSTALARPRMAVGVTMPIAQIAHSLRWARRVLTLATQGVVEGPRILLTEEHLIDVWLSSDPALLDRIAEWRMGPLLELPAPKQSALTETLRVWLESWSTAADVGRQLHVHPQTVRYRLHQVKEALGNELEDPEARFGLELTLRALRLRERAQSAPPRSGRGAIA